MKRFLFLVVILLVSLSVTGYSADLFNQGTIVNLATESDGDLSTYSNVSGYYETETSVTYLFKATWVDSSDHYHSKPFFIGDCNNADAYVRAIVSAASDVNPIYHFSYDNRNTWTVVTPATLDALSSTAVGDTLGMEAGTNDLTGFHTGVWMVVELADGSTALNDGEVCTWVATFTKDIAGSALPLNAVAMRSNTNP